MILRRIVLAGIALFAGTTFAEKSKIFDDGVDLFNAGKYNQAIKLFKIVEVKQGGNVALYYNLASSYFKTGNYNLSKKYFKKITSLSSSMQTLVNFNLALIAKKQGKKEQAKRLLKLVENQNKDLKLKQMAINLLQKIDGKPVKIKKAKVKNRWSGNLMYSFTNDTNPNFIPNGSIVNVTDTYTELLASTNYRISNSEKDPLSAGVAYYNSNYETLNYDFSEIEFKLKKKHRFNKGWKSSYAAFANKSTYAHAAYQSIFKLKLTLENKLSKKNKLVFKYGFDQINSNNGTYDYLQGYRQKSRIEYRTYEKDNKTKVYYEFESNNRQDKLVGSVLTSYSPNRHSLRYKYTNKYTKKWHLITDISYRVSDYSGSPSERRTDKRLKAALISNYYFGSGFKIKGKFEYSNQDSTDNQLDYNRSIISISLSKSF